MKRAVIFCFCIAGILFGIMSCGRHRLVVRGFVDEPLDSIIFDLKDHALPASEVCIWDVEKAGGYYYFTFYEIMEGGWGGSHYFLMAASEDKLEAKYVPLPEGAKDYSNTLVKNDTLVIRLEGEDRLFSFDPKKWEWAPYTSREDRENALYEDDDWTVKYVDHGEFGNATWFIDKHSKDEYAFLGLYGDIHRIDSTLYVVGSTRVYALSDPTVGFHCDSLSLYENAKDTRLISLHFHRAGYDFFKHTFLPDVHFDNEPAAIEKITDGNLYYYVGGFYVSEYAKADTTIVGSFVASDTLFCTIYTPSGLELAKLKDGHLTQVHRFNKNIGKLSRYSFMGKYPDIASVSNYRDRLLVLFNDEAGSSELYDIARDGNILLKLRFDSFGLKSVEQDGFAELLSFYLEEWDRLTWEKVVQIEEQFGGEVSYLNLGTDRNRFPPQEIFSESEAYHIDMVTKRIGDTNEVESSYWVQESDNSIPAIHMNWSRLKYNSDFDPEAKYEELAEIITSSIGTGTLVPGIGGKMKYTEWHSGQRVIRLYGNRFNVRFLMY